MRLDTKAPEPKVTRRPPEPDLVHFDYTCPKGWHPLFTGVVGVDFHAACESDNKGSDE